MTKKLYAAFLPLLAVTAFTVMPAVAQAAPHWYSCESKAGGKFKDAFCKEAASSGTFEWAKIKEGESVTVKTKNAIEINGQGFSMTCEAKGKEKIENPVGGGAGVNSISELLFMECMTSTGDCLEPAFTFLHNEKKLSATNTLPATLIEKGGIRDEIREIEWELHCGGALVVLGKKNSLTPKVGSSVMEFGEGSGALEGTGGGKWTIAGNINLEGPIGGKGITAKNP